METGTIKWFNSSKGYGFISREEGDDIFVHYNAIEGDGYRTLEEGDKVEFEIEQGPKGLQASKVTKIYFGNRHLNKHWPVLGQGFMFRELKAFFAVLNCQANLIVLEFQFQ